jgi:predicted nucleic acid-binding protein
VTLAYFDSSAFVKLLAEEEGSGLAAELWDGCDAALASRLAYPEVRAALAAAARNHDLTETELNAAERDWDGYWSSAMPASLPAPTLCAEQTRFTWPAPWPLATPA